MILLAILLSTVTGFLIYDYQQLQSTINTKTESANANAGKARSLKLSPEFERKVTIAHETQRALNKPWEGVFIAIEHAQFANPEIHLLSVEPNPAKAEIVITGQTSKFDTLVRYMSSLRAQPVLGEAVINNQREEFPASGQEILSFTLTVVWKL